jgi:hypothetical protein
MNLKKELKTIGDHPEKYERVKYEFSTIDELAKRKE